MSSDERRRAASDTARRLALAAFGAVVVLSPFRAGVLLAARPVPPVYAGYTDLVASWSEVAVVVTLVLWLTSLLLAPRPVSFGPRFLRWPIAGLLLLSVAGVAWSIDPALSLYNAGEIVLMAGLALYVLNEIPSLDRLMLPLGLMLGIQGIVGIGQVLAQRSIGLAGLGELSLDPRTNGVSVVATSAADRLLRAYGLTDHPNILGGVLAFGLPLLAAGLLRARPRVMAAGSVALGAGVVALVLTFSRAAWLALAVGLLLALAMHLYRRDVRVAPRWAAACLAIAAVGILAAVPFARYVSVRADAVNPASVTEEMSIGERSILVGATNAVFIAHPLGGTGLATLPIAMMRSEPALTFDYQPASVVVLDVAAETGVFAASLYGLMLIAPLVALWHSRRRWTPELIAVSGALVASSVVGFFDYYTWSFAAGRIWAWLLLGLWAGMYAKAGERRAAA